MVWEQISTVATLLNPTPLSEKWKKRNKEGKKDGGAKNSVFNYGCNCQQVESISEGIFTVDHRDECEKVV